MILGEVYSPAKRCYTELPDIPVLSLVWVHFSTNFLTSGSLYPKRTFFQSESRLKYMIFLDKSLCSRVDIFIILSFSEGLAI